MAGAASQVGDADSSRAPGLTSGHGLPGSVNFHRGALLFVPHWQCISSFVFYFFINVYYIFVSFLRNRNMSIFCFIQHGSVDHHLFKSIEQLVYLTVQVNQKCMWDNWDTESIKCGTVGIKPLQGHTSRQTLSNWIEVWSFLP